VRWVNALLFGLNAALLGILGWRMTPSLIAGVVLAALFVTSGEMFSVHAVAMSEPLFIFLSLLANLFVPWGVATDIAPVALAVAVIALLLKLGLLGLLIAVIETRVAKLRLFRVPELLGVSFVLALLAVTSSFLLR